MKQTLVQLNQTFMKQLIIITLLFAKTSVGISQYTDSLGGLSANDYLTKSRNQRSGAIVLTVAGSIGLLGTLVSDINSFGRDLGTVVGRAPAARGRGGNSHVIPYLLSAAAIVGAIPLYVGAAKNKQTYYTLSAHVKFEERSFPQQGTVNQITYPALAFKVQLR
jgi:hypothetical protein